MKRLAIFLLLVGAGLCWFGSTQNQDPEPSQESDPAEKKQQDEVEAIEALKKLGASVSSRRTGQAGGYHVNCRAPLAMLILVI